MRRMKISWNSIGKRMTTSKRSDMTDYSVVIGAWLSFQLSLLRVLSIRSINFKNPIISVM